jgi:hypothetical protein
LLHPESLVNPADGGLAGGLDSRLAWDSRQIESGDEQFVGSDVALVEPLRQSWGLNRFAVILGLEAVEDAWSGVIGDTNDEGIWGEIKEESAMIAGDGAQLAQGPQGDGRSLFDPQALGSHRDPELVAGGVDFRAVGNRVLESILAFGSRRGRSR